MNVTVGDALPGAVQIFTRALGVTEAELYKMMEQGKLLAAEVLPKVAGEFRKAALQGGAFEKALKGLRVTEGQMITQSQRAADTIFKSGFSEGLSILYKTISELLKDSGKELEKIGRIFGTVFKGVAYMLKIVEPLLKAVVNNIEILAGAFIVGKIYTLTKAFSTLGIAIKSAFLPVTAALFALEEISSLMSDKVVGTLERQMGKQFNITNLTQSELYRKDGKLFSKSPTDLTGGLKDTIGRLENAASYIPQVAFMKWLSEDSPANKKGQSASTINTYVTIDAKNANANEVYQVFTEKLNSSLGR